MKYHPIRKTDEMDQDYSHNRDYIGKHWNRKYIRAVQAVLNSTKGKIGKGTPFFKKAFGENLDEYFKLLEMPETMIIYRLFFEWMSSDAAHIAAVEHFGNDQICESSTDAWWTLYNHCKETLPAEIWEKVNETIHRNDFDDIENRFHNTDACRLLSYYCNYRKDIVEKDTDLYLMKQVYDAAPTIKAKLHYRQK